MVMKIVRQGEDICCYDPSSVPEFSTEFFTADYWQRNQAVTGQSHGRGVTWFVQHHDQHWVLRHYWRGGWIGRYISDSFFFQRLNRCRSFAEYELLQQMLDDELPVPRPIAARVRKHGLIYQSDILIERIPDAQDLVQILTQRSIAPDLWQKIGQVIAQFHQAGVFHADLNAHNILLDADNKVWLIDFDKGSIRHPGPWQMKNLARLQRSFQKESTKHLNFHWQSEDWQSLLVAYQSYR